MYKKEIVEELLLEKFSARCVCLEKSGWQIEEIHTYHRSGFFTFVATFKKYEN